MSVIVEVLRELAKMFFGEPRMAIPILAVVALAAAAARYVGPLACAGALLFGCLLILAENVFYAARKARK